MAAGRIEKPGSEFGPCENECDHVDCRATRLMADDTCRFCDKPIGYGTRFYREIDNLVHALCLEESVDNEMEEHRRRVRHIDGA